MKDKIKELIDYHKESITRTKTFQSEYEKNKDIVMKLVMGAILEAQYVFVADLEKIYALCEIQSVSTHKQLNEFCNCGNVITLVDSTVCKSCQVKYSEDKQNG